MKFNQKQVSEAGLLIGYKNRSSIKLNSGEKEPDPRDLLAMSAVAAGLEPWTPEYHNRCEAVKKLLELVDETIDQEQSN